MYDVVVIGGGPAGLFSIFSCGLEGLSCAIFDSSFELGGQCKNLYSNKKIYDIPACKELTGGELIDRLLDQISIFKYDVFLNSFVSSVEEKDNVFIIKSGENIVHARSLIIALGSGIYKPIKISAQFNSKLEGYKVFYSIDNIEKFREKTVAILGGGDSAFDWSLEVSTIAKKVYLIHRRSGFKACSFLQSKVDQRDNIEKIESYFLRKIEEKKEKLHLFGDSEIVVDYVLPFYGSASNVDFLNSWDLKLNNSKIVVDFGSMQTSRQGIYAIGDCITYSGKRNLILTGFSEGMIASRAIFKFLYPNKAFNSSYSTNSDIFK